MVLLWLGTGLKHKILDSTVTKNTIPKLPVVKKSHLFLKHSVEITVQDSRITNFCPDCSFSPVPICLKGPYRKKKTISVKSNFAGALF